MNSSNRKIERSSARFEKSENKDMRNPYRTVYTGYTDRLHMRPFQKYDASNYSKLANDEEVQEKDFGVPLPFLKEHATSKINYFIEAWNNSNCFAFALRHEERNCLMGGASLMVYKHHSLGELGYWLGKEYWGQGYATEAATAMLHFGFEEMQLDKISAQTLAENSASANVLRKAGMQEEGLLRQHWIKDGRRVDLVQFGMLSSDL